jgi:hypothetical protein
LQKQIVALICPPDKIAEEKNSGKLIIVGDDDQSIYYPEFFSSAILSGGQINATICFCNGLIS